MHYFIPFLQVNNNAGGGMGMSMIFIFAIILVFYFFMIRPQQKKQKQVEEFRSKLEKGHKITTIGGIHGKIVGVKENTFLIEIANDVCIEIDKAAVSISDGQLKEMSKAAKEERQ